MCVCVIARTRARAHTHTHTHTHTCDCTVYRSTIIWKFCNLWSCRCLLASCDTFCVPTEASDLS